MRADSSSAASTAVAANAYTGVDVTRSDVDALPNALDNADYDVADVANADANMPNVAYHLCMCIC